jgi:hypothetical protein
MLRRIRLLEYVRARRRATTGRIGLGLHRTTRAALRSIGSSRDTITGLTGASCGPDLVGPGRLTCCDIGTSASADPRSPSKSIRHSARRAKPPLGGAGPSRGSARWRTRKRTTASGPSGAMGMCYVMRSCKGLCVLESKRGIRLRSADVRRVRTLLPIHSTHSASRTHTMDDAKILYSLKAPIESTGRRELPNCNAWA